MKKKANDEKILVAMDAIDKSVRALTKFGERYNQHIDQAALRNDKKRVHQLIRQKLGVYALIEQLTTLKGNVELGALTAKVVGDMGKLPDAIAGCKGLLSQSPNFKSLGDSIKKIFKDMQRPVEEISNLNDILDEVLSPKEESSLLSRLDETSEIEKSDKFKAEYDEMMIRVGNLINSQTVTKPASEAKFATGDFDIDALLAEENKKD